MPLSRWRIVLALLVVALSMPARAAHCDVTLRVAAHGVWREPHTARHENELDQEILQRVADKLHWCLSWEERETNITRRLAMIRDGDVDVLIGASKTPERSEYAWFSSPYRDEVVQLFVRSEDRERYASIHSIDALQNSEANLVALRDCWLGPDYAQRRNGWLVSHRVYEVDSYAQGRGLLLIKRADLFIAPDTFDDFLKVQGEARVTPLDWQPYRSPVYFMFSRKSVSSEWVSQFNEALAVVMRNSDN